MSKKATDQPETAVPTITLELTPQLADHLAKLLNVAQLSGNAAQLRQLLATHDELIARFNEAAANTNGREEPEQA